jgi:HEAT repeat protein
MSLFGPPNIEKMKAKKDVKGLIKALGYKKDLYVRRDAPLLYKMSDPVGQAAAIREAAAQALGQIGDPQAVDSLITALKDEESFSVKKAAMEALGQIGDARAVDPLIDTLKNRYSVSTQYAARALGEIGDARAVDPLIAALKSKDEHVRQAAAEALVRIGAPAVETLTATLKDKDRDARQAVVEILDKLNWRPRKDETGVYYWIIKKDWKRCVSLGSLAVEPLSTELIEGDRDVRQAVAQALGEIGDARAVEPLIAALKDKDGDVCKTVVEALGEIGDAQSVKPLILVLNNQKADIRQAAVEALGKIGSPVVEPVSAVLRNQDVDVRHTAAEVLDRLHWQPHEDETGAYYWSIKREWERCVSLGALSVEPLIAALEEKDKEVREAAAEALGEIGDARAIKPLIARLDEKEVRQTVVDALVKIGIPAVEPLFATLREKDLDTRQAAAEALDKLTWQPREDATGAYYWAVKREWSRCISLGAMAVEPLIAALEYLYERQAAIAALVEIGAPSVKPLIVVLKDLNNDVRQAAIKALGMIGDANAVKPLVAVLEDRKSDLRQPAARALGEIGDARAVKPLIAALEDQFVRPTATEALIKIGKPAVSPLCTALRSINNDVRGSALMALGEIGDERAVKPLIAALENPFMRPTATEALIKIGKPAVEPLISTLKNKDADVRRAAARALVLLYTTGNLDEQNKQTILALRGTILGTSHPHDDHHGDDACLSTHHDIPGAIVEFPL